MQLHKMAIHVNDLFVYFVVFKS